MKELLDLIQDIHQNAKDHGWYDQKREVGTILALINSEIAEAFEFYRAKDNLEHEGIDWLHHYSGSVNVSRNTNLEIKSNQPTDTAKKPDGYLPELADAVIRIFDHIGDLGLAEQFVEVLKEKHEFNKSRPYKHGGKTV